MAKKDDMRKILDDADKVQPIATYGGVKITTFEDGATIRKAEAILDDDIVDKRLYNPDGTVARSGMRYASVNVDKMFANRCRYVKKGEQKILQIVLDYRAISEQATGNVYLKNIPVYELVRNGKKLEVLSVSQVEDKEFLSEFKEALNMDAMLEVMPVIDAHGSQTTKGELAI